MNSTIERLKELVGHLAQQEIVQTETDYCAGCGFCCEVFMLEDPQVWRQLFLGDKRVQRWLDKDIIPLSIEEVLGTKYLDPKKALDTIDISGCWYYSCRLYNKELQRCTSHNDRPFICRNFPSSFGDVDAFTTPCNMAVQLYSKNGDQNA